MARLELASLGISPVTSETAGALAAINEASVELVKHGTTEKITVYHALSGETAETQPLKTNARGAIPGFIEESGEQVDVKVSYSNYPAITYTITVPSAAAGAFVTTGVALGAKVEQVSGTIAVRLLAGGNEAVARSIVEVKTGETLATGEPLFTVPTTFRPAEAVYTFCGVGSTSRIIEVTSTGEVINKATSTTHGTLWYLDSLRWRVK